MNKITITIICFLTFNLYSQKDFSISKDEISEQFYKDLKPTIDNYNLKDLRKSENKEIRIWKGSEILTLGTNSNYILHVNNENGEVIQEKQLSQIVKFDSIFNAFENELKSSKDFNQYGIDVLPTVIEINSSNHYRLIAVYKNETINDLISSIRNKYRIENLYQDILEELPKGTYQIGMTTLKIDHLINEKQSQFYKKIIPEIKSKLKITEQTSSTKMPLIFINNVPSYFEDLNNLDLNDVQKYEIINDKRRVVYGTSGDYGVINIVLN